MTELSIDEATEVVKAAVTEVAPDAADDLPGIDPTVDLWDELELDSMDHQNVMVAIYNKTGVDIPEREYARLRTLGDLARHLSDASS